MADASAPRRVYTLTEANAAIPQLAARVDRLRHLYDEIRRAREVLDVLWERLGTGEALLGPIAEREAVFQRLRGEFERTLGEIGLDGIVLRGLDPGIADFHADVRGMPVFLCWRVGESRIGFWHSVDEGFAGRKPIETIDDGSAPRVH